jgi:hypothetical protein
MRSFQKGKAINKCRSGSRRGDGLWEDGLLAPPGNMGTMDALARVRVRLTTAARAERSKKDQVALRRATQHSDRISPSDV